MLAITPVTGSSISARCILNTKVACRHLLVYYIQQNVHGRKLLRFSQFFTQSQIFPMNHGLVNWKYNSTKMLQQEFIMNSCIKMQKFFLQMFCLIWYTPFNLLFGCQARLPLDDIIIWNFWISNIVTKWTCQNTAETNDRGIRPCEKNTSTSTQMPEGLLQHAPGNHFSCIHQLVTGRGKFCNLHHP